MKIAKLYRYNFFLQLIILGLIAFLIIYKGGKDGFEGSDWMIEDKILIWLSLIGSILAVVGLGQGIYKIIKRKILKGIITLVISGLIGYFIIFILFIYVIVRAGGPSVDDYDSWKIENGNRVPK